MALRTSKVYDFQLIQPTKKKISSSFNQNKDTQILESGNPQQVPCPARITGRTKERVES